jgi:hypothetical protein
MNTASNMHTAALKMLQRFIDEDVLAHSSGYLNPVELLMAAARDYALTALPGERDSREAYWIETLQQELDGARFASSLEARPTMQKLYYVRTTVPEFKTRGCKFKDVILDWFVTKHEQPYTPPYSELITGYDQCSDRFYPEDAVDEMFTAEEALALLAWLNEHRPGESSITQAKLPISSNTAGCGAVAVGGPCDFLMVCKSDDWDLPFKAWAYFDVRDCERMEQPASAELGL